MVLAKDYYLFLGQWVIEEILEQEIRDSFFQNIKNIICFSNLAEIQLFFKAHREQTF